VPRSGRRVIRGKAVVIRRCPAAERVPGVVGACKAMLCLCRPGILIMVGVAGLSGMIMAGRGIPDRSTALPCIVSILLASAGSAMLNSVFESSSDRWMARLRTRTEALAILGPRCAVRIGALFITASLVLASLHLSLLAALLILAAVVGYLFLYTLRFKRTSPFAAIPGGIPGALPVLIGYAATGPGIGFDGLILFLLVLLWQPPHFWILALRRRDEYRSAGLPVLPAVMGEGYTKASIFAYALSLPPVSLSLWFFGYCSPLYASASLLLAALFLTALYRLLVGESLYDAAFRVTNCYLALLLLLVSTDICLR
jgi:protoheme IX farnesyltransferase